MTTLPKIHPLTALAAVSLTLFSLLGIGAITGFINPAKSELMPLPPAVGYAATAPAPAVKPQVADAIAPKNQMDAAIVHGMPPAKPRARTISRNPSPVHIPKANVCGHCGEVASIRLVKQDGEASGLGAVAGGIAGGVVGNQIGKGKGNVLMTILGAGGGAYAGHTIEQKVKATTAYVVKVHMNDGSNRVVTMADKPTFEVGDQVKVINGGVSVLS